MKTWIIFVVTFIPGYICHRWLKGITNFSRFSQYPKKKIMCIRKCKIDHTNIFCLANMLSNLSPK